MLAVRLEGCGWSQELDPTPLLRIECNLLKAPQHGEVARYSQGYWFADGHHFVNVTVEPSCFVRFEDLDGSISTKEFGPYSRVRTSGGSLWILQPQQRLLAKWLETLQQWHCLEASLRLWPVVAISASPAGTGESPG